MMMKTLTSFTLLIAYACAECTIRCNPGTLLVAVDKSRSIDDVEMARQLDMVEIVLSDLHSTIDPKVSLFAKKPVQFQHNQSDPMQGLKNALRTRDMYTNYVPVFKQADQLIDTRGGVLLLLTDGSPFTVRYKNWPKSTTRACDARNDLRESRPDIHVLCFQATNRSKALFDCACDGYVDASDNTSDISKFICGVNDDCSGIDNKIDCEEANNKFNSFGKCMWDSIEGCA